MQAIAQLGGASSTRCLPARTRPRVPRADASRWPRPSQACRHLPLVDRLLWFRLVRRLTRTPCVLVCAFRVLAVPNVALAREPARKGVSDRYHARNRCPPANTRTMRVTVDTAIFCANPDPLWVPRRLVVRGFRATILGSERCLVRLAGSLRFDCRLSMLAFLRPLRPERFLDEAAGGVQIPGLRLGLVCNHCRCAGVGFCRGEPSCEGCCPEGCGAGAGAGCPGVAGGTPAPV